MQAVKIQFSIEVAARSMCYFFEVKPCFSCCDGCQLPLSFVAHALKSRRLVRWVPPCLFFFSSLSVSLFLCIYLLFNTSSVSSRVIGPENINLWVVSGLRRASRRPGPRSPLRMAAGSQAGGDVHSKQSLGAKNPEDYLCLESDVLFCTEPTGEFLDSTGLNSLIYLFSFNFGFRFLKFWVSSFFLPRDTNKKVKELFRSAWLWCQADLGPNLYTIYELWDFRQIS